MRTVLPSITPIFLSNESAGGLFRDALWAHSVITLYAQIFIYFIININVFVLDAQKVRRVSDMLPGSV